MEYPWESGDNYCMFTVWLNTWFSHILMNKFHVLELRNGEIKVKKDLLCIYFFIPQFQPYVYVATQFNDQLPVGLLAQ